MVEFSFQISQETLRKAPALSAGICIFAVLFYAVYPEDSIALVLFPYSPLTLSLNAISFYIFPHVSFFHLLLNLVALFPLISRFERVNGTVNTGVTLNILAVSAALSYCLFGLLLFPDSGVAGLSGICFSFLTYFCQKEHVHMPILYSFTAAQREIKVPTQHFPFINLLVVAIFVPSSSFFGHLAGMSSGYLLASGYLNILYPPSKVILFIERKLGPGINHLKRLVDFVSEEDAVNARGIAYQPLFPSDLEQAISEPATVIESFERRVDS